MTPFWNLSAAGFVATAITYGPARMGFGLFLPQFKSAFTISSQTAGLVSGLGFAGFLVGLLVSQAITNRKGPRLSIVCGLVAATVGSGIVATAPDLPVLAGGVLLAMSSAGFAWAPFNNAIHRKVEEGSRPAALSLVSTGTSLGIAAAGAAVLLTGTADMSWRLCWAAFALAAALSLVGNWLALREVAGTPGPERGQPWTLLLHHQALPLLGIGLCYGVTSSIYISFAADRIAEAGGLAGLPAITSGGLVFISYGVCGLIGLFTGRAKASMGLPRLLRLLMAASALSSALLALMPTSWGGAVLSAGLQGAYVMMMSAVLAFWSERLFPDLPSQSFTVVLLAVAVGSVFGPAAAGFASEAFGAAPMFLGTAGLTAVVGAAIRTRHIRERPGDA